MSVSYLVQAEHAQAAMFCRTFDRIIDGSRNVFVRFDKEYAYGEAHDAWKEYAKTVGESAADLLSADVGVSEYGEKENSDLIERYGIKTADFPQYRLFVKGTSGLGSPIAYTGAAKTDEFVRFVQEKAGAWIGLPGQIKELDEIAKEFMGSTEQAALLQKAEAAAASSTQDTAKYYVKVSMFTSFALYTTSVHTVFIDNSVAL
uniref:Endoplasmic reticulum resident protein 29 C-terminal domain-containing protein n=1 Tax=Chrysotila carterae TaxID=13221 RepID=A0A7S4EY79_CHRCT